MSCNGCRVLRKGCSDACILRSSLQWIESPEAQGHATVFVAKFFGRAGMISFISAVPESQRPALFQSLLYEACGRTVNPVFGAVGLLWSGNWGVCQGAVETVLKGGTLGPLAASMPALSPKPTHYPTCKSKFPPLTNPAPTPTISFNPSPKRPQSKQPIVEASTIKQVEACMQQHELLQEASNITSVAINFCQEQVSDLVCNHDDHKSNNFADMLKDEQSQVAWSHGLLHAPRARRVKPRVMVKEEVCDKRATSSGEFHDNIGLDLSLNSHTDHAEVCACRKSSPLFMRVSSPLSFSVNSEGSVTNSDTAEYTMSCLCTLTAQAQCNVEERKLLHLL